LAGIVCLQNEGSNYVFGVTKKGKDYYLLLEKNKWPNRTGDIISEVLASTKIDMSNPIHLKVTAKGDDYEFMYSTNGTDFSNLGGMVSGDILATNVAGGFTGALIGLYATSGNNTIPE
jgi:alpha-N-arabinofuranosidase